MEMSSCHQAPAALHPLLTLFPVCVLFVILAGTKGTLRAWRQSEKKLIFPQIEPRSYRPMTSHFTYCLS